MGRLPKRAVERLLRDVEAAGDDRAAVRDALVAAGVPPTAATGDLDALFELVAELNETRRVPLDPDLERRARAWLEDDPDPVTRDEVAALLDAGEEDELTSRFGARLTFGTAGIRGELGAGPSRMNLAMVRMTTAGVVPWLVDPARGVVVGRDGRHRSDDFADEVSQVLSGAGVPALVLPGLVPTPVLAFAVRHLGAAGGLMVTASHNPPTDNGVKVYGDDGAQIIPPSDHVIAEAIDRLGPLRDISLSMDAVRPLGDEVLAAYIEQASKAAGDGPRDVKVVHTAMHGVGWEPVRRLFVAAGFHEPVATWEQAYPDGSFPTVKFPNPEEPGALDRALAVARTARADVVLANDPDADRLGVAIRDEGTWRSLTGDEIGTLLAEHVLRTTSGTDRLVACSLVSSSMLERIAAAHGVHFRATLTGFKWVARAADDVPGAVFAFGYEEALGYSVGNLVRDKDGLTAALAFADLTARVKADGSTIAAQLETLARTYGLHATRQWSIRAPMNDIAAAVDRFVSAPPAALAGRDVTSIEHPATDIVVLHLGGDARVIVRPSGTEPKLKTYYQVVRDDVDDVRSARVDAASSIEELRVALVAALGLEGGA